MFSVQLGYHDAIYPGGAGDPEKSLTGVKIRQLAAGPRLYLAPLWGWLRLGLGFGKHLSREVEQFARNDFPSTNRILMTYTELYAGVVPLRRGDLELEVGASRTTGDHAIHGYARTIAVVIGLRWRGAGYGF